MTRTKTLAIVTLCLLAVPCAFDRMVAREQATAQTRPVSSALDPAVASRIDEYMDAQVRASHFSGTILLARDGKPLVAKGYGLANAEWQIPNTPDTKFRVGSITKQFTSMLVMRLQEQGKLKVHDPICTYVAPCPDTWKPVTIQHLLTHTSGIPSYTDSPDYLKTMMVPKTLEDMVAGFRGLPLEFEPGSRFKYDNSGYFLLGLIIAKTTGKKYEDALQSEILDPLSLKDTGYDRPATILAHRASGYGRNGETIVNAPYLDMVQPYAAGALYSTVQDLLIWDQALYTDKLLPASARTEMFTPFKEGYAYGWFIRTPAPATFGRTFIEHGGGINGFATMIVRVPDDRLTSIVLSNFQTAPSTRIAHDLLGILYGEPLTLPVEHKVAAIDPKLYDAYLGRYALGPTLILTVTHDEDRLMVQLTGQPKFQIFPESENEFFLRAVDAQLTFVKDADGKVVALILHQNGRDQRARKIE
jgi:CubicO group peptidase (beta-lactamase class C family)